MGSQRIVTQGIYTDMVSSSIVCNSFVSCNVFLLHAAFRCSDHAWHSQGLVEETVIVVETHSISNRCLHAEKGIIDMQRRVKFFLKLASCFHLALPVTTHP